MTDPSPTGSTNLLFPGAAATAGYTEPATEVPDWARTAQTPAPAATSTEADLAPVLTAAALHEDTPAPATGLAVWGGRGRANRASLGLLRLSPGAEESAHLAAVRQVREASFRRTHRILVTNPKGGAGKTTASILLAGVYASIRGGQVAAVEVAEAPGSLIRRGEGTPGRGLEELLETAGQLTSAGELAGYLATQTSTASLLGSAGPRRTLTGDDVRAVTAMLDRFFAVIVMDSGNNPLSGASLAAVMLADRIVIPTTPRADSVFAAMDLIDLLRTAGGHAANLAAAATVVLTRDGGHEDTHLLGRLRNLLNRTGTDLFEVPYDAHLATGSEIVFDRLAPQTRHAWTRIAAHLVTDQHVQ